MKPYYQDTHCTIYHGDTVELFAKIEFPEIDLILTDPPYGIGEAAGKNKSRSKAAIAKDYGVANWDNKTISQSFINGMIRDTTTILFGGNYYAMPPSQCWLVWDKQITGDFADCELAWTNLNGSVRRLKYVWNGMIKQKPEQRWHPTQKPHDVMTWCIHQADTKQKITHETILDPFMGSGSTLRAAKDLNRKAIGIELEEKYCEVAAKRLSQEVLPL